MRLVLLVGIALVACKGHASQPRPPIPITDLEPTSGDPSGGKVVQIVGTNFDTHSTVEVKFGDKVARAIVVAKDRIQLESPPGKAGEEVEVTVRFPDGRGGKTPQKYRWEPQGDAHP